LLLIDEPGSGATPFVPGFGVGAPQSLCPTPTTGCPEFAAIIGSPGGPIQVATDTKNPTTPAAGANVFQGIVSSNSVTWFGVPVLPPGTTGFQRVFRFTNIRANASKLGSAGSVTGATPVIASIGVSAPAALPISNVTPTVGIVQSGLKTSVSANKNFNQCVTASKAQFSNVLTFTELFGTAFKTRTVPNSDGLNASQTLNPKQNVPGAVSNAESNFVLPIGSAQAGLADYGTRLKATFNNVPNGVTLWVSVNNTDKTGLVAATHPTTIGGFDTTNNFAQLVTAETAGDTPFPSVASTDTVSGIPVVAIPSSGGTATATWEVVNTNPNQNENFYFGVFISYTSNVAQNTPPVGSMTVNMSFAPTPPAFTAASAASASSTLTIPRFVADPNAAAKALTINVCQTVLLFPFVTAQSGFDTGIAIANTSTDPFGTGPQAGTCSLNWYSGTTPPPPTAVASIASGTVYTNLASVAVPGFQGYMIAVCKFQYAHGFAFISDLGARNLAMGYLALVIPDPTTQNNNVRNASSSGCGVAGGDINCNGGESDGH